MSLKRKTSPFKKENESTETDTQSVRAQVSTTGAKRNYEAGIPGGRACIHPAAGIKEQAKRCDSSQHTGARGGERVPA